MKNQLTLLGLDIGGEWNVPLLRNAAEISGASLLFAQATSPSGNPIESSPGAGDAVPASSPAESLTMRESAPGQREQLPHLDRLLGPFDHVLACEATRQSRAVYDYACPRGHVAVIVGNELKGIPGRVLKRVDQVVSVPMLGRGMSSVNVAVAAAISLYALDRDLARRRIRSSSQPFVACTSCIIHDCIA